MAIDFQQHKDDVRQICIGLMQMSNPLEEAIAAATRIADTQLIEDLKKLREHSVCLACDIHRQASAALA